MAEKLEVFDLQSNLNQVQDRKEFYSEIEKEFHETGHITRKVKTVKLILMNSDGRMFIQRRSRRKEQNAGLYDKTIGGHVMASHTWYLTVVKECHEELGCPTAVLEEEEFLRAVHSVDLRIIGLLRKVDYDGSFGSSRKSAHGDFKQPQMCTFYVGYYDGPVRFKDGESVGIELFTPDELGDAIAERPEDFTEDLKYMIKKYRKYLIPVKGLPNAPPQ